MKFHDYRANVEERPTVQVAPLIDIVFLLLIFFIYSFVFQEIENEISISVPTAEISTDAKRFPGEIIINIRENGTIVVNQREMTRDALRDMLLRVSGLYKGQPVIIRGDQNTRHKDIIGVLDVCATANIWNVSFATRKENSGD